MSLRHRFFVQLEPSARMGKGLSPTNRAICWLILLSALFAILETEPTLVAGREQQFLRLEDVFTCIFLIEYFVRLWIAGEDPRYGAGVRAHLRYLISTPAIIDLLAIVPILLTFAGSEVFLLRLFRFARILRVARLGRFSKAVHQIAEAVTNRKHELLVSLMVAGLLLVVTSTLLYLIEGDVQPDAFGSIPRAMWWSVATLTTVGYGDVYPHTALGRFVAALTAVAGIGLVAMPTGILAAAFSDVMHRQQVTVEKSVAKNDSTPQAVLYKDANTLPAAKE
jgi:voltage-gated potassium channel